MSILGYAQGGASILGPSDLFRVLPFRGYRDRGDSSEFAWREEFADALGGMFEVAYQRFIVASARANMLDPTFTPSADATDWLATAHEAPAEAASQDTMLDLLAYIALATYPLDQNWSVARRQAMIQVGWDLFRRKGNRVQLGAFTAAATDSEVAYAVTNPPWQFSLAVTDGEPSPGFKLSTSPGGWCYTSTTATVTRRPWLFAALRNVIEKRAFPAWSNLGIGYMQFRAGFSAAGEPIFPSGATLNLLSNEHFSLWTGANPDDWTNTGGTQNTSDASRNHEFAIDPATGTSSCLELDLTGIAAGTSYQVLQGPKAVNNQVRHRIEVDYAYRQAAAPFVSKLWVQILDDTNSLYYTGSAWTSTATKIAIEPSSTSSTRTRYGFDFALNAASATTLGTNQLTVTVGATSDGTASSQISYKVYRVGLYEQWSTDDEEEAGGERTLWLPLVDAYGRTDFSRTAVGVAGDILEPASADRSSVRVVAASGAALPVFPHHPALTTRGVLFNSEWAQLAGDNVAFAAWTASNCTITANATVPPIVGASTNTATTLTQTGASPSISFQVVNPTVAADRYVCGIYMKKITADASTGGAATIDIELREGATTRLRRHISLASDDGWRLLALPASDELAGASTLDMFVRPTTASGTPAYGIYAAYCYEVTGKPGVMYPPIVLGTGRSAQPTAIFALNSGNINHPDTRRQMVTLTQGVLALTVVPMFDGTSQPDGYLFDCGQGAAQNRISLRVTAGTLQARIIDDGTNSRTASITLAETVDPAAGSMTWLRDTAIDVRMRWDATTQGISLSAGNGFASSATGVPWTVSDASLGQIYVGVDRTGGAGHFDGIITNAEVLQVGPPLP